MFLAVEKTIDPIKKNPMDTKRGGFLPNASEILAQTGCKERPHSV
jgi:hypothetical protein